mgnify:FL=1
MKFRIKTAHTVHKNSTETMYVYHVQTKDRWWSKWVYVNDMRGFRTTWYSKVAAQVYININKPK